MLTSQLLANDPLLEQIAIDANGQRISTTQNRHDPAVLKVQQALLMWDPDCLPVSGADGDYGDETAGAVRRFKVEVIGVQGPVFNDVGPKTVLWLDAIALAHEQAQASAAAGSSFIAVFNPLVTGAQVSSAVSALANAGGRPLQAWGGPILIADGDANAQAAIRDIEGVALVTGGQIPNIDLFNLLPDVKAVIQAWNMSLTPGYQAAINDILSLNLPWSARLLPRGCDLGIHLAAIPSAAVQPVIGIIGPLPFPPNPRTLRHPERRAMVGHIGVVVFLVGGRAGTEAAFTEAETIDALTGIKEGLHRLQKEAPIEAGLVFHPILLGAQPDLGPESVPPRTVLANPNDPTKEEELNFEKAWRDGALKQLRDSGVMAVRDGREGFRDIVSNARFMFSVDWGYVILITKFRASWDAYAPDYENVIISYTMWKEHESGIGTLPFVVAHESGHTVNAFDEYGSCNALDRCGWSNTVNGNCKEPFGNSPCLMDTKSFRVCEFTRKHFGWNDKDNDGVVDPYDEDHIIPGI